jgi:hypothetical protein
MLMIRQIKLIRVNKLLKMFILNNYQVILLFFIREVMLELVPHKLKLIHQIIKFIWM